MALFSRRRPIEEERRYPASLAVSSGEVASVRRYDLNRPTDVTALLSKQREWQQSAWYYVDEIGEMKDATRFIENACRRVRLYAGFQRDPDAEPIAVADSVQLPDDDGTDNQGRPRAATDYLTQAQADEADAIIASFAARDGGQPILMGKLGLNIFLVGEAYIINRETASRRPAPGEDIGSVEATLDWEVRSRDEIRQAQNAVGSPVEIIDHPEQREGTALPATAFIERVWRQHARFSGWADSNVRAAIGTLEEMDLLNRLARSSTRSRILAGIVTMPDELDFGDPDQPADGSSEERRTVGFDREIEQAMSAVITNESDANSVAPLTLRGPAVMLKEVRVIEMPRRYGQEERDQYKEAIAKLGRTIELPLERLAGLENVNHWGAWLIDENTYAEYVQPLIGIITEALAYGLLRPMLADAGWSPELIDKMTVVADASMLVARPDHGKVAVELYGLDPMLLGADAVRKANSFGEDDAPSDEEIGLRTAIKAGMDPALAARLMEDAGWIPATVIAARDAAAQQIADQTAPTPADQQNQDAGTPNADHGAPPAGSPSNQTVAVAAAGAPRRLPLTMLSHADAVLASRVQTAVDAAMVRAQEKTGARLRTIANKNASARGVVATVPNEGVVAALGPGVVASLTNGADLWSGVFDPLHDHWTAWVGDTQALALDAAVKAGQLTNYEANEIRRQQEEHRSSGWDWLLAALVVQASLIAAGEREQPAQGEYDPLLVVPPGIIREATAVAGGETDVVRQRGGSLTTSAGDPVGGVATGVDARQAFALAGAPWVGYEWLYGNAGSRQEPYEPHLRLSGVEFSSWNDPKLAAPGLWPLGDHYSPGDHLWCQCSFTPIAELHTED